MKIINITEFEQGGISDPTSEYRVKTGYIKAISTDSVTVDFTADGDIQAALLGFEDETSETSLFDLNWYDTGNTFNLTNTNYCKAKYWRLSIKYKDNSKITPNAVTSLTITIKNYWYIDKNGDLHCDDMPYAPAKSTEKPYPLALWRIDDGDIPYHGLFPEIPEKAVSKPYPKALWRIDYLSPNLPYHALMPLEIPAGAFMNAVNLEYARIPETVRKIGRWAFTNTALHKVRISSECEYYETSFPENCVIEFYGKSVSEHSSQLYDSDGNILIDADGARIYAKEV